MHSACARLIVVITDIEVYADYGNVLLGVFLHGNDDTNVLWSQFTATGLIVQQIPVLAQTHTHNKEQ